MKSKVYILLLSLIPLSAYANTRRSEFGEDVSTTHSSHQSNLIHPILNELKKREYVEAEIKHRSTQALFSDLYNKDFSGRGDVFMGGVLSETADHPEDFAPYQDISVTQ